MGIPLSKPDRLLGNAAAPFTGTFDGNGKTITINSFDALYLYGDETEKHIGLFGYINGGRVENLHITLNMPDEQTLKANNLVDNRGYTGNQYAGGIAGYAENTEFEDITLAGSVNLNKTDGAGLYLGGIAGYLKTGAVSGIVSSLNLNGKNTYSQSADNVYVGGLLGYGTGADIRQSAVSGTVSAASFWNSPYAGGVAGYVGAGKDGEGSSIYRVAVTGAIDIIVATTGQTSYAGHTSSAYVGGLAGHLASCEIAECYTTGTVSGISLATVGGNGIYAGGITGYLITSQISDCYSLGAVSATGPRNARRVGGIAGYCTKSGISECYAAGELTAFANDITNTRVHAGGIAGTLYGAADPFVNTIENCAALAPKLSWKSFAKDGIVLQRVANFDKNWTVDSTTGTQVYGDERYPENNRLINNIANQDMVIEYQPSTEQAQTLPAITLNKGADTKDGADTTAKPDLSVFTGTLHWNSAVWKMGTNGYPALQWQN
jgi:hypothetical protein